MTPSTFTTTLVLTAAAAILAACSGGASLAPQPVATASAPAPVAGYDWFYHDDEGEASLAYGLANSDDMRLGLACRHGSGAVELSAVAPSGTREIHLESGGDTERFSARGEPSELHDGDFLIARSKATEPVFQRFRRLGWMAQWIGDRRETYVAQPGSAPDIERFFAVCG